MNESNVGASSGNISSGTQNGNCCGTSLGNTYNPGINTLCPNCGYCPCCGRPRQQWPIYPYYPTVTWTYGANPNIGATC